jgi:hypothetical protein
MTAGRIKGYTDLAKRVLKTELKGFGNTLKPALKMLYTCIKYESIAVTIQK